MGITLENTKEPYFPPQGVMTIIFVLWVVSSFLTTIIVYLLLNMTFLYTILFGILVSGLLSLFVLWVMYSVIKNPHIIHLKENEIVLEFLKGRDIICGYDKVIGITNSLKVDKDGKPLWAVFYLGKSMYTARGIVLTPENGTKIKAHLDSMGIEYKIDPR